MAEESLREAIERHIIDSYTGMGFGDRPAFPEISVKVTARGRQRNPWLRSDQEMGYEVGPHAVDYRAPTNTSSPTEPALPAAPTPTHRKRASAA